MNWRRWSGILIFGAVVLLFLPLAQVDAAPPPGDDPLHLAFTQSDLDGDGTPDLTLLKYHDVSNHDYALVYDGADDMVWSSSWKTATDFTNDTWVFFTNRGSQAKLIITFEVSPGTAGAKDVYRASLFDDVNQDGKVDYTVDDRRHVHVTESSYPSVIFLADAPWLRPDGNANPLITFQVYRGTEQNSRVDVPFPNDGRMQFEVSIEDRNGNGLPDAQITRSFPDIPPEWLYERTGVINLVDEQPVKFSGALFFPFLGKQRSIPWTTDQLVRTPGSTFPPVLMDWDAGQIRGVAGLLPLWGGQRINFNSFTPLKTADDADNLLLFERFGHFRFTDAILPTSIVRWSLGQNDLQSSLTVGKHTYYTYQAEINWQRTRHVGTLDMDYKLELAGIHEAPKPRLQFDGFSIREIPFQDWLTWFTSQKWVYTTFVAVEGFSYTSNETIYEWNTVEGAWSDISRAQGFKDASRLQTGYLFGFNDESPKNQYTNIREGLRGEYADLLNQTAKLYFSPVDRKLHLYQADHGVWNIDRHTVLRYANLGGSYLNQWQLYRTTATGQPEQQITESSQTAAQEIQPAPVQDEHLISTLTAAPDYLVYATSGSASGTGSVILRRTQVEPALFEALPPRTAAEWRDQEYALAKYERELNPVDLEAMMWQFAGAELRLTRAALKDFRLTTSGGFRAVLELQPGYRISDPDGLLSGADALTPGSYLLESNAGVLSVHPLSPPVIVIDSKHLQLSQAGITELQPVRLTFPVRNLGLQDLYDVQVRVVAVQNQQKTDIGTVTVDLPARETQTVSMLWSPESSGTWSLEIQSAARPDASYGAGGVLKAAMQTPIQVQPLPRTDLQTLLSLDNDQPQGGFYIVVLFVALWLGAIVLFVIIAHSLVQES